MLRRWVQELLRGQCALVMEKRVTKTKLRLVFCDCFHSLPEEEWGKGKNHKH